MTDEGPSAESIMLEFEHEDVLREISKLPPDRRRDALNRWKNDHRSRAFFAGARDICTVDPKKKTPAKRKPKIVKVIETRK